MKALLRVRHGITYRKTGPVLTARRRNPTSYWPRRKTPRNTCRLTVIESFHERSRPRFQHARRSDRHCDRSAMAPTRCQALDRCDDRSARIVGSGSCLAAFSCCRSLGGSDAAAADVASVSTDASGAVPEVCDADPVRASNRVAPSLRRMRSRLLCVEGIRLVMYFGGLASSSACEHGDESSLGGSWRSVERWTLMLPCRLQIDDLSGDCALRGRGGTGSTSEETRAITPGIIVDADAKIRSQGGDGRASCLPIVVTVDECRAIVGGVAKRFDHSHCLFTP